MSLLYQQKPFSQACENNKIPILQVLTRVFARRQCVLEIGSGTGQHAQYLAAHLPGLFWQTSDQPQYHRGISQWLAEANLDNLGYPLTFTIGQDPWPSDKSYDAVFTANTTHIMQSAETQQMMQIVGKHLPPKGIFCQYGPFLFSGTYTSPSNAVFDKQLRSNGYGGICDVEQLKHWTDMALSEVIPMPANNHMLVWTH